MIKKKNKKKKLIILTILLILLIGAGVAFYFLNIRKENEIIEPKKVEVLDKIVGYDYSLEDRDTEIYKETFLELKKLLESEEKNDKQYAEYLAKLFIIDLYTIDNKISKYDVGSLDFIYPEEKEKFQNKVLDTMYKLVEDNTIGKRNQELPIVTKVELTNVEEIKYKKGNTMLEGYQIDTTINYKKDLGYDQKVTVTLVKEEEKIYVVQINKTEE